MSLCANLRYHPPPINEFETFGQLEFLTKGKDHNNPSIDISNSPQTGDPPPRISPGHITGFQIEMGMMGIACSCFWVNTGPTPATEFWSYMVNEFIYIYKHIHVFSYINYIYFHKHPTSSMPFRPLNHFIIFPISNNQLPDFQLDRGTTIRQRLQLRIHQGHIHRRSRRQIFLEAVQGAKPLGGFPRTRCLAIFGSSGNSKTLWVFWGMKFKLVFFFRFNCLLRFCFGSLLEKPVRRRYINSIQ